MKAQTRMASLKGQGINILIGFTIQWVANFFVLPWFGMHPSTGDLFGLGAIFTVISVTRGYIIRRIMERKRAADVPPDFQHIIEEIAAERERQIQGEGYSLAYDDTKSDGSLAAASAAYAFLAGKGDELNRRRWRQHALALWPWAFEAFKPTTPRRDLIKAAALSIAEVGRLDRRTARVRR